MSSEPRAPTEMQYEEMTDSDMETLEIDVPQANVVDTSMPSLDSTATLVQVHFNISSPPCKKWLCPCLLFRMKHIWSFEPLWKITNKSQNIATLKLSHSHFLHGSDDIPDCTELEGAQDTYAELACPFTVGQQLVAWCRDVRTAEVGDDEGRDRVRWGT